MGDLSSEQIQLMLIFAAIGVFIIAFPLYDYYTTKKQCEQAHREWIREQEERKRERTEDKILRSKPIIPNCVKVIPCNELNYTPKKKAKEEHKQSVPSMDYPSVSFVGASYSDTDSSSSSSSFGGSFDGGGSDSSF